VLILVLSLMQAIELSVVCTFKGFSISQESTTLAVNRETDVLVFI
jgi:hypothetical protein